MKDSGKNKVFKEIIPASHFENNPHPYGFVESSEVSPIISLMSPGSPELILDTPDMISNKKIPELLLTDNYRFSKTALTSNEKLLTRLEDTENNLDSDFLESIRRLDEYNSSEIRRQDENNSTEIRRQDENNSTEIRRQEETNSTEIRRLDENDSTEIQRLESVRRLKDTKNNHDRRLIENNNHLLSSPLYDPSIPFSPIIPSLPCTTSTLQKSAGNTIYNPLFALKDSSSLNNVNVDKDLNENKRHPSPTTSSSSAVNKTKLFVFKSENAVPEKNISASSQDDFFMETSEKAKKMKEENPDSCTHRKDCQLEEKQDTHSLSQGHSLLYHHRQPKFGVANFNQDTLLNANGNNVAADFKRNTSGCFINENRTLDDKKIARRKKQLPDIRLLNQMISKKTDTSFYINHLADSFLSQVKDDNDTKTLMTSEKHCVPTNISKKTTAVKKSSEQISAGGNKQNKKKKKKKLHTPENLQRMCQKLLIANDKNILQPQKNDFGQNESPSFCKQNNRIGHCNLSYSLDSNHPISFGDDYYINLQHKNDSRPPLIDCKPTRDWTDNKSLNDGISIQRSNEMKQKRKKNPSIKGLITTCTISEGIFENQKASWKQFQNMKEKKNLSSGSTLHNNWANHPPRGNLQKSLINKNNMTGYINPMYDLTASGDKQQKPKRPKQQNLGPEFFAKICNLWPDLIARLAHDINLDLMSPEESPKPPEPPNNKQNFYWGDPNGLNNNPVFPPRVTNKCCSPEATSCPQLPLEYFAKNINNKTSSSDVPYYSTSLTSSPKPHLSSRIASSSLDNQNNESSSSLNLSPRYKKYSPIRKQQQKHTPTHKSSSKHTSFDVSCSVGLAEGKPSRPCQSPICGSPRPAQPVPKPNLTEEDILRMEEEMEKEQLILHHLSEEEEEERIEEVGEEKEEPEINEVIKGGNEEEEVDEGGEIEEETKNEEVKSVPPIGQNNQRMRRKLPEIPKDKKSFSTASILALRTPTLAEEIQEAESGVGSRSSTPDGFSLLNSHTKPILVLKCHSYLRDDSCSPDSDFCLPVQDIDSGHSTQHSPDGMKSFSPGAFPAQSPLSSSVGVPESQIELLDSTHRGLYRFIPRHPDELEIEIGDPIYVQKEADDLWCEGVNLRTGRQGIFPAAHVTDVDYSDFDPTVPKVKKERYLLNYLGSIETLSHKGNQVLCQAVRKIAREDGASTFQPHSCILEVSDQGIRMVDKSQTGSGMSRCHDYFYHLKHVSFCGFHPKDPRYFGFITKHPSVQRFACHVFESIDSTRPVAEAVGRAFQRFYKKYVEAAYPTEDIYIE